MKILERNEKFLRQFERRSDMLPNATKIVPKKVNLLDRYFGGQ